MMLIPVYLASLSSFSYISVNPNIWKTEFIIQIANQLQSYVTNMGKIEQVKKKL